MLLGRLSPLSNAVLYHSGVDNKHLIIPGQIVELLLCYRVRNSQLLRKSGPNSMASQFNFDKLGKSFTIYCKDAIEYFILIQFFLEKDLKTPIFIES